MKEYVTKEKEEIRLKRAARTAGDFYVPAQPKVYFVVRIRGYVATLWSGLGAYWFFCSVLMKLHQNHGRSFNCFVYSRSTTGVSSKSPRQHNKCSDWLSLTLPTGAYSSSCFTLPTHISFPSEPNLKSVRELIYKRGYGKVDRQRIPLSNNQVIEEALGKYNILSIEDLVHEIVTVGPNFKQV